MKNSILASSFAFAFFACTQISIAQQTPFGTIEYLDVNNIKAAILVHGDMWYDPSTSMAICEFPKGSGKSVSHASALWMGGYDAGNNLHVSAQTYRQDGNDYWPGPLDANDTLTYASSDKWAKIWKVNLSEITAYLSTTPHTLTNTPSSILEWPAKGNPYAKGNSGVPLTITEGMAPFVDVDNNGSYDPLTGDYPDIKGDQALWWVFSDNGPTHDNSSNAVPLKVEVHAMAYAYSRGTLKDNVQYYNYTVYNRSANDYTKFRMGIYADVDLGAFMDDYIGFDSSRRMGIAYNGKNVDGNGEPDSYGVNIPQMGITMINMPGDNQQALKPVGSFMYYNNDFSTALGNPAIDEDYYNYLNATWKDAQHLTNDFSGTGMISQGRGAGPDANYAFPGNPSIDTEWSECASANPNGDRRFIIATSDYDFNAGDSTSFTFALIATAPAPNNGCPSADFTDLQIIADSAWSTYVHPLGIATTKEVNKLKLYPNPASDKIYIDMRTNESIKQLEVYDMLGRTININTVTESNKIAIDVRQLPVGVYTIRYQDNDVFYSGSFVKE